MDIASNISSIHLSKFSRISDPQNRRILYPFSRNCFMFNVYCIFMGKKRKKDKLFLKRDRIRHESLLTESDRDFVGKILRKDDFRME